jgi:hypothetical protein
LSQISQISNFSAVPNVLNNPHAKKSSDVKSGDLGGQGVGPPLPTQRPGNVSSRNVVTFLWKWGGHRPARIWNFYVRPYTSMWAPVVARQLQALSTDKHVVKAWKSFRYLSSHNRCPHWSVLTCIKNFLSYSIQCWKNEFHKYFRYKNISIYFCIPIAWTPCI